MIEPQIPIDIDRSIHIFFAKPISRRIKLWLVAKVFQAERIELRSQMAANPVSPDHHQRMDGVFYALRDFRIACRRRLLTQFFLNRRFGPPPVAIKSGSRVFVFGFRKGLACPTRAVCIAGRFSAGVSEL